MRSLSYWLVVLLTVGCDDSGGGDDPQEDAEDAGVEDAAPEGDGQRPQAETRPEARFQVADEPAETPLADVPWPSDLYRAEDGALDLRGFPEPTSSGILQSLRRAIETNTPGFGTSGTLYLAFDGPLDVRALPPDPRESLRDDAVLFLVDVDPQSAERGRRWPIAFRLGVCEERPDDPDAACAAAPTQYLPPHHVNVRLLEGVALRPSTTYALVVTEDVAQPSESFSATLGDEEPDGALGRAWEVHAPLRAWLEETGVRAAGASVFTTQDPVSDLFAAREFITRLDPPPLLEVSSRGVQQSRFELFIGRYRAPRFQEGEPPYRFTGGRIVFEDGQPVVQGEEEMRFALSVPLGDMPEGGWPLVLYAHGTGGDYDSFASSNSKVASVLARHDIAVLGIDQIHHGPRGDCDEQADPGTCVSIAFFNFLNPIAARDNVRQAAIDIVSQLRFARTLDISAEVSERGVAARVDPERVMFMGHSQGGINGPLFLAIEPTVRGAVFSGSGASIAISIEQKTRPFDINGLARAALVLPDGEVLDRWHPALMLMQTFIEPGDSVNFARFWFHEPPEDHPAKSVFMTVGLLDEYTPPDSTFALAAAARIAILQPVSQEIEALDLLGIDVAEVPPFRGNVGGGDATAGLAQFPAKGHFAVFKDVSAQQRYARFLQSVAETSGSDRPPQIF